MRTNFFLRRLETILPMTQFFGAINSLAQAVLKITSPGMPDIYQGNELWDLSLVDPDNRRPVDFDLRSRLLDELSSVSASERVNLCHELLTHYQDGRVKLWTTMRALRFRRANAELFQKGSYLPLEAIGEKQENVCAFARELGFQDQSQAIVVTPLLSCSMMKGVLHAPLGDVWGRSELLLPHTQARSFENIFTGERIGASENGTLLLRDVFRSFPVAILTSG
jgi:(1->4)-alpha-D-glucan 1-alpha-D-glucosylmutase